jgi:hypothetical protein
LKPGNAAGGTGSRKSGVRFYFAFLCNFFDPAATE